MADKKISALTALTAANVAPATDVVPIVDTSATETKKVTAKDLVDGALNGGSANGVLYLNGSKAATSGSALVFDGTNLGVGGSIGTTPSLNKAVYLQSDSNNAVIGFSLNVNDGANNRRGSMFLDDSAGLWGWDVTASSGLPSYVWRVATSEVMRLNDSGNLGIGTSSPQSKLHIDGGEYINSAGTLPALSTSIVSGEIHAGITNTATTDSGYLRLSAGGGTTLGVKAALDIFRESGGTAGIVGYTSGTERFRIDANGNVVAGGSAALATNATNGFLYVPTCAGTPTGTPTAITGMAPIVVNTTNNKLYFYSGGAWRDAGP